MSEFFARQASVLHRLIAEYRGGELGLNALIQRVEAIGDALGRDDWKDAVFPIVLDMEQVNAVAIEAKRSLAPSEQALIDGCLLNLEALIKRFEGNKANS